VYSVDSARGWTEADEYASTYCRKYSGKLSTAEMPAGIANASKSKRYECKIDDGDVRVVTITEGRYDGRPVFIRVRAFNSNLSGGAPVAEIAELFWYLKMGS
jgi:hypothetical protein